MHNKNVSFSKTKYIKLIPSRHFESRGIASYLSTGIFHSNNKANIILMQLINRSSPHKIITIDQEDMPLKISSDSKDWYEDDSPLKLLQQCQNDKNFLLAFIVEFNRVIYRDIEKNKSAKIKYKTFYKT